MDKKFYHGEEAIKIFIDANKNIDIINVVKEIHKLSYLIHLGDLAAQYIERSYNGLIYQCESEEKLHCYFKSRREEFGQLNLEQKLVSYKVKSLFRTMFMVSADLFEGIIVDIGAGNNSFGKIVVEKCSKVTKVVGVDIEDINAYKNKQLEFVKSKDKKRIDLPGDYADIVIFRFSLHHMDRDTQKKLLTEAYRILKKRGSLIIVEDTFSVKKAPIFDNELLNKFMGLGSNEKYIKAISYMDASSCFLYKEVMPFTFEFRCMEDWEEILLDCGYKGIDSRFWGIPFSSLFQAPLGIIRGVK